MSDVEIQGLKFKLSILNVYPPKTNLEAIQLIKECVRFNEPIPEMLNPWVGKACNSWLVEKGHAVSTVQAAQKRANLVWHIRLDIHKGSKPGKAIERVAEWSEIDVQTLSTYYYSKAGKALWAEFDEEITSISGWGEQGDVLR